MCPPQSIEVAREALRPQGTYLTRDKAVKPTPRQFIWPLEGFHPAACPSSPGTFPISSRPSERFPGLFRGRGVGWSDFCSSWAETDDFRGVCGPQIVCFRPGRAEI